jgi:GTPase
MTRAGFVAIAGRPNVGKSTLVNRIVGGKVAIVSDKPQTTRRAIRGIATTEDWQLVLVDLPGSQRPRDVLTERMQRRVERELGESDAVLLVVNGEEGVGPGDRFLARAIRGASVPCAVAVNKIDRVRGRREVDAALRAGSELVDGAPAYPLSAKTGAGVPELVEALVALLPEGPFLYPPEELTDLPREVWVAEIVREQVLRRTREELPHAVEVEVDEIEEREDGLLVVVARVWAETESQKGILIGRGGQMVRAIGAAARTEVEAALRRHVHLDLSVRVRKHWRRDEGLLDRLGID